MARMQRSLFAQLNALTEEIAQGATKAAATKAAEGPTPADPGTYTGASSHPTAHVDNNVQTAETGARASEYEADIKKQQGALAVDNTPELPQEGTSALTPLLPAKILPPRRITRAPRTTRALRIPPRPMTARSTAR
jgi:hypothetical protein